MGEIKWAYDERTGSFSALPASPFLLVALCFLPILALLNKGYEKYNRRPRPLPPNFDKEMYDRYAIRYKELKAKQATSELTLDEKLELQNIIKPPWSGPGEYWQYH